MPSASLQLTEADLAEAATLHKDLGRGHAHHLDLLVTVPFFYLLAVFELDLSEGLALLVAVVGAGLGICLYAVSAMARSRRARRDAGTAGTITEPQEITWSETGLTATNRFGTSVLPWKRYTQWAERDGMVLLYTRLRVFQILPRRIFADPAEIGQMQQYLVAARVRRVGPKQRRIKAGDMRQVF